MSGRLLTTVTRTQGNNAALKEGQISPSGFILHFQEVPVLVQAFRRMVRERAYDVCEMAITTYLCAREHGVRFTAIPVFLVRGFHHGAIVRNVLYGASDPRELEGKRVGVNRGYTVTTGVWARAVLQEEYNVNLNKITWVLSGDEHVQEYRAPANVVSMPEGETMERMLAAGELAAAIGIQPTGDNLRPLIEQPLEAGIAAYKRTGCYPINHLIVVRDELLAEHAGLAAALFDAFTESKRVYVQRLEAGAIETPTDIDLLHATMLKLAGDPLPYGIEPNRFTLEKLIRHASIQGILRKPVSVEDMFDPSTHTLTG